ncbi:hypothetical protein Syun_014313 [Stephania yunnanensis]|uniref:Uncharacterized protein n=1 Tax=Stephania yunnanensis TaxID=152371 RepID=A0AAP0JJ33_9MAGN
MPESSGEELGGAGWRARQWASSAVAIAQGGSGERGEPWRVKAAALDDGDGRSETTQARERGRQPQWVAWTAAEAAGFRTRGEGT